MRDNSSAPVARRSFLSRFGTGLTIFGAAWAGGAAPEAQQARSGEWQAGRHAQDDWLDGIPGKHRLVFDTTSAPGLGSAMLYANNYFLANQSGYELKDSDLAVVIVVRHNSTAFAYNNAVWSKYGATLSRITEFMDPKTKEPFSANPHLSGAFGIEVLTRRGIQLAVCQMATRRFAGVLAQGAGGTADAVYNELVSNLVPNAHMVPAGIVALNRAQERGYSLAHGG